jgi:zinc and cadmium transporter
MNTLLLIILSCFLITACALSGVFFLYLNEKILDKISLFLVSLSAGALMGGAFLHLLPEAQEKLGTDMYAIVLVAFMFFFILEKLLHWQHCHKQECEVHSFGYMNLVGDTIHNFIDGLVIASTFLVDPKLGITTTLVIALHEIPQEIGDFGVLVHAGFKKTKAIAVNYLVALSVVAGGVVGYFASFSLERIIPMLLPFAAGGFIYIAASDLMPEIRKEKKLSKSIISFLTFVIGIIIMYAAK